MFDGFLQRYQAVHREHWISLLVGFLVIFVPSRLDAVAATIGQSDREIHNNVSQIGMSQSSIFRGEAISQTAQSDPIYRRQSLDFGFPPGDMLLRAQTPTVAAPTGKEASQPPKDNPINDLVWVFLYFGYYVEHHIWPWFAGPIVCALFGFLFGRMEPYIPPEDKRSKPAVGEIVLATNRIGMV